MLPQTVRQNHDVILTWLTLLRQEITTKEEWISQHLVVSGRGFHAVEVFGPFLRGNNEIVGSAGVEGSNT
jgi:hypothetical protein